MAALDQSERRKIPLRSHGVTRLLRTRFADGEWHALAEAVDAVADLIPAQIAHRQAVKSLRARAASCSLDTRLWRGRRDIVREALSKLGATFAGARSEMPRERFRLPTEAGIVPNAGEQNGRATLSTGAVAEIRERYARGSVSHQQLADEYGVGRKTITDIVREQTWGTDREVTASGGHFSISSADLLRLSARPSGSFTAAEYDAVLTQLRGLDVAGAITAEAIVAATGLSRRKVRAIISAADGVDILIGRTDAPMGRDGRSAGGYTLARTQAEARDMTLKLQSQATQMQARAERRERFADRLPAR